MIASLARHRTGLPVAPVSPQAVDAKLLVRADLDVAGLHPHLVLRLTRRAARCGPLGNVAEAVSLASPTMAVAVTPFLPQSPNTVLTVATFLNKARLHHRHVPDTPLAAVTQPLVDGALALLEAWATGRTACAPHCPLSDFTVNVLVAARLSVATYSLDQV